MSNDNIDYAELDKAVNEAMQAQPIEPATRPAARAAARPATKTVTVRRAAARPQNHGHIMDFAPRGNNKRVITQPLPTKKMAAKPAAAPRPARPAIQQQPTVSNIPQRSAAKPSTRVATIRRAPVEPELEPELEAPVSAPVHAARPTANRESIAAKIQQKRDRVSEVAPEEAPKPKVKATPRKAEAPDANSYSLGGRSPFLADTKVEKRPLGANIPEANAASIRSTKNVYSTKSPTKAPATKRKKHTVTEAPKTHSGWLWTLIVILVIAAGAGLGYLAYLIVFANQL